MLEDLKPYPQVKESGVEWLGEVPEHWGIAQVKRYYAVQLGKMLQPLPRDSQDRHVRYLKARNVQWFGLDTTNIDTMYASPDEIDHYGVNLGDLLVCEGGEGGRCALAIGTEDFEPCIIQNALHRVRPRVKLGEGSGLNDYLKYILSAVSSAGWFDALNDKATIAHFTAEKFGALPIPMPTCAEQTAIAHFLDHATDRIERYIRTKQKLIALLEEQKQVIIHDAVTGQIDVRTGQPYPAYKDSGVGWLGKVPATWQIAPIKRYYQVQLGKMLQREARLHDDLEVPYLKAKHVQWFNVRVTNMDTMWASPHEVNQYGIAPGDLLVCEGGEGGRCGIVMSGKELPNPCIIQNALHRVRPRDMESVGYVSRNVYLQYLMSAIASVGWFEALNDKATIAHFTAEKFGTLLAPIPPFSDQAAIVEFLGRSAGEMTSAIDKARRGIKLLTECRTCLIADVVTGKLDVREAAVRLSDDADAPIQAADDAGQVVN